MTATKSFKEEHALGESKEFHQLNKFRVGVLYHVVDGIEMFSLMFSNGSVSNILEDSRCYRL
jgi:hypothetical protein